MSVCSKIICSNLFLWQILPKFILGPEKTDKLVPLQLQGSGWSQPIPLLVLLVWCTVLSTRMFQWKRQMKSFCLLPPPHKEAHRFRQRREHGVLKATHILCNLRLSFLPQFVSWTNCIYADGSFRIEVLWHFHEQHNTRIIFLVSHGDHQYFVSQGLPWSL